jgi:hypothetical protein
VFRLAELFGELSLPVLLLVNAAMVEQAPQALACGRLSLTVMPPADANLCAMLDCALAGNGEPP